MLVAFIVDFVRLKSAILVRPEQLKATAGAFFNLGDAPAAASVRIAKGGDNAGTIAIIGVVSVGTNVGCFRGPCSASNLPVTVQIKSENGLY